MQNNYLRKYSIKNTFYIEVDQKTSLFMVYGRLLCYNYTAFMHLEFHTFYSMISGENYNSLNANVGG